jgi:hypothetical protein
MNGSQFARSPLVYDKPRTTGNRRRIQYPEFPLLVGQRPSSLTDADPHASVCSAISKASSTSMPRYRTVLSSLV